METFMYLAATILLLMYNTQTDSTLTHVDFNIVVGAFLLTISHVLIKIKKSIDRLRQ